MLRLCILVTSPRGPVELHRELVNSTSADFFFVTHDEKILSEKCLGFYYHDTWAANRNHLYEKCPKGQRAVKGSSHKYDYYMFLDYDVKMETLTNKDIIDQILEDLEKYKPAVMVPTHERERHLPRKAGVHLFSNNQMKIVHRSLLHYFFPLPAHFGGFWDCCAFWNVLELVFAPYIIRTPHIIASSLASANYAHNDNPEWGNETMQKAYEWIRPAFKKDMPEKIDDLKRQMQSAEIEMINPCNTLHQLDFMKYKRCGGFNWMDHIDNEHEHFNNLRSKRYGRAAGVTNKWQKPRLK